ncbi:hypothetical protein QQ008_07110 [Fulvivirgaceae bacterium BMA10]|uniref:Uncharacterized protein n=1 Tax=Splendidivirga corallicola TaxID=3051826 RepID=A0ABT8KM66_9BACT|nr:hypothetical protein [Fulvivirgaceae bacterium BMA10]
MNKKPDFKSVSQYLNMLNMFYYLLVGLPLAFFVFFYLENKEALQGRFMERDQWYVLKWCLIIIALIEMFAGEFLFRKILNRDLTNASLQEKLHVLFRALVVRYAAYFSASLFAVVPFYFFKEGVFTVIYLMVLFAFSLIRPTIVRIVGSNIFGKDEVATIKEGKTL